MKNSKPIFISIIVALFFSSLPLSSFAQDNYQLTIVNHFNEPLTYTIGINPPVLPDFPVTFTLNVNEQIAGRVIDIQKEAYIRVGEAKTKQAFWGVEIENGKVKLHGYISKGIAYSWKNSIITFCTPDEYKQRHTCNA